jgi:hypothetical protein
LTRAAKHRKSDFSAPLTFEQSVDVFYEQTLGWQLHIADLIANGGATFDETDPNGRGYEVLAIRHSGFAMLHICLSYFELVGSLVAPKSKNLTDKFKAGVREVLPSLFNGSADDEKLLKCLHKGARCGLYHLGRTRSQVGLGGDNVLTYIAKSNQVVINPSLFPVALKAHLKKFRLELLNPANVALRQEFQRCFDNGFE